MPAVDPDPHLPEVEICHQIAVADLREISANIPVWMDDRGVREKILKKLSCRCDSYIDAFKKMDERHKERVYGLYCYMASSYVHARHENTANRIPADIAVPLTTMAKEMNRPPILNYSSYCLTNWRRINPEGPIALGNIELIQHFTRDAKRDEAWFILVHVDIEARAIQAIDSIIELMSYKANWQLTPSYLVTRCLVGIDESLKKINATMARMPEECSPDIYYNMVRPYIFGFNNVIYEDCFNNAPQTFRGETGAQSSIVPAVQMALGVVHVQSLLTRHLDDMRQYMPFEHREFLTKLHHDAFPIRPYIAHLEVTNDQLLAEVKQRYNSCLTGLLQFRRTHLQYAIEYIQNRVENPTGTGGTPYINWLSNLVSETEGFFYD